MSGPIPEPSSTNQIRRHGLLTEGFLLAASSALAYTAAIRYEIGAAEYFGYPDWMVRVELTDVIATWIALTLGAGALFIIFITFAALLPSRATSIAFRLLWRDLAWLIGLLLVIDMSLDWWPYWILAALIALLILVDLWASLAIPLRRRGDLSRTAALERSLEDRRANSKAPRTLSVFDSMLDTPGLGPSILILYVGFFLLATTLGLVGWAGKRDAIRADVFMVSQGGTSVAMIRRYGDLVILAPIDTSRKVFRREFAIRGLDAIDSLAWRPMHLHGYRVEQMPLEPNDPYQPRRQ